MHGPLNVKFLWQFGELLFTVVDFKDVSYIIWKKRFCLPVVSISFDVIISQMYVNKYWWGI